jgi:hypothetical protein
MPWLNIFQPNFAITPFYCFGLVFIDVLHSLKSVEAAVLIDPALASSGVIASSPNNSLKGVNPVDLDMVVLWL